MSVSPSLLIYLCIGLAAGVLSGMFGIGGGIVIVPALVLLSSFSTKTALGTSLGALLLPVGLLGAYTYWENGNLDVRASLLIAVGLTLGVAAGARLAQALPRRCSSGSSRCSSWYWPCASGSRPDPHEAPRAAAFRDGQPIPAIHSCDGEDRSPPLSWTEIPSRPGASR